MDDKPKITNEQILKSAQILLQNEAFMSIVSNVFNQLTQMNEEHHTIDDFINQTLKPEAFTNMTTMIEENLTKDDIEKLKEAFDDISKTL